MRSFIALITAGLICDGVVACTLSDEPTVANAVAAPAAVINFLLFILKTIWIFLHNYSIARDLRGSKIEMQQLSTLLEGLEDRGADVVALASMRSAVGRLRINLKSLDKLIADRMILSELKRGYLSNALTVHNESQNLLTPWLQIVDGEIAQSRKIVDDTRLGGNERAAAGRRLVDTMASYQALQRVQFLITSANDRLQQTSAAGDSDGVRVQVFRIQQSLREAGEIATGLDSRLQPALDRQAR